MTEEEVDLRIRNALLAAATAEAAPLPGETEPPIPLSLRRRMRHLLSDPFGKKLLEASQRMGGAALSEQGWLPRGDSGIWTRVARFLGRHTPLKPPAGAGPDAPLTGWAPAWLPEGYAPVSTQDSPALRQSLYARGEESLTFTASAGDGPLPVEQEGREERPISVARLSAPPRRPRRPHLPGVVRRGGGRGVHPHRRPAGGGTAAGGRQRKENAGLTAPGALGAAAPEKS